MVTRYSNRAPVHPGEVLREDVLPELGLSVKGAANMLGVSRQALHAILRQKNPARITPEMAVRIGKFCGNGPRLWINMQTAYDLWHAEQSVDVSGIKTMGQAA